VVEVVFGALLRQSCNSLAADALALLGQLGADARRAVGAAGLGVDGTNAFPQRGIAQRAPRRCALEPVVEAAGRDIQHAHARAIQQLRRQSVRVVEENAEKSSERDEAQGARSAATETYQADRRGSDNAVAAQAHIGAADVKRSGRSQHRATQRFSLAAIYSTFPWLKLQGGDHHLHL